MTTTEVENFPGFPEGIQGPQLMDDMREQAERFGAELVPARRHRGRPDRQRRRSSRSAARCTSRTPSSWPPARSTGTWAWTTRPGCSAAASRPVPPATGSSSATRTSWSSAAATPRWRRPPSSPASPRASPSSTVAHELRASKIMQKRAQDNEKIRWALGKQVTDVHRRDHRGRPSSSPTSTTGSTETLPVSGLFVAIGHDPRSELFAGQLKLDDEGYIQVEHPSTRTNIDGRLRLRRRRRPHLPAGHHLRRHRCGRGASTPSAGSPRPSTSAEHPARGIHRPPGGLTHQAPRAHQPVHERENDRWQATP